MAKTDSRDVAKAAYSAVKEVVDAQLASLPDTVGDAVIGGVRSTLNTCSNLVVTELQTIGWLEKTGGGPVEESAEVSDVNATE